MPIISRIVCSMNQNVHIVKNMVNKKKENNGTQSKMKSVGKNDNESAALSIPQRCDNNDCVINDNILYDMNTHYYNSKNKNLNITTSIVDEGNRVIIVNVSEWFDSKLGKTRKHVSQTIYDV